jgi:hypothetical protein
MYHHLENLISLIRQSRHWPHKGLYIMPEVDPDEFSEPENRSYSDRLLGGHRIPVSRITDIDNRLLPPPDELTFQQQAILANELEILLLFFHFRLDFPGSYPTHLRYTFILKLWSEKHVPVPFGENHIVFCDYKEETCPFTGYCNICTRK